ncbi:MAG: PDZ domain-containing protein [Aquificaceae bacterium]|jgi:general secretion pathway protein C|uniref:PDZ domain-containing protein n=1 Tax=Hydrogenobacter sp. Uz 6-8 TaxID=3384828 RepID=UPI0030AAF4A9
MLTIYPALLFSFGVLLLLYTFLLNGIKLTPPQLHREEVQPQTLFAKFDSLYPKEEKKEEEKMPSITLLATATGSARLALAVVDGQTKTLRIGSQVGGYRVVNIERNYLLLSKGEQKVAIGFRFGPEPLPQASAPSPTLPSPQASRSLQASIPKGELERITADPGIMFRMIRLVPFVQDGRTRGFLFEWVEPGSVFERSGIRPGDVLLSINNQEIKSGEDAFRILQVLRNESSIKLNLQRGNELIDLSLRVE